MRGGEEMGREESGEEVDLRFESEGLYVGFHLFCPRVVEPQSCPRQLASQPSLHTMRVTHLRRRAIEGMGGAGGRKL